MSGKSLDDFADAKAKVRFEENHGIARENRTLRATLAEQTRLAEHLARQLRLVSWLEASKIAPPVWMAPRTKSGTHLGIPTLQLTDVHFDEVINPEQIGGYNKYNRRIALQRLQRVFEKACIIPRDYLSGVQYDGFQLNLGGDMFSGFIHEELTETNEGTIMESLLALLDPLVAGITLLAKEFKQVNVAAVVGNHSRNSKKPRAKFRAQNNFDWLLYKLLERHFASDKRITWNIPDGADARYTLFGTKYLLTHGDQFHGGSGIAGAMSPLLLGVHRKTAREVVITGDAHNVMAMGHWHQTIPLLTHGLMVGGCLCGYGEFAYLGNFKPEPPQQAFWVTTPEHGPTFFTSIFVQDRKAEGW